MRNRAVMAAATLGVAFTLTGCLGDPVPRSNPEFPLERYPEWEATDPEWRLFPGDMVYLDILTAPELSVELVVEPDGRVTLPRLGKVMAANLTTNELQKAVQAAYGRELVDPSLNISLRKQGSQKIFVGGEVRTPGVVELPGEIDPLQAIIMAGGWTESSRPTRVIVMRRAPGGTLLHRVVDVRGGLARQELYDIGPLRRFDVVWVTRSKIADENLLIRQFFKDALPVDFSLIYDIARF